MSKYSIHFTKQDAEQAYKKIAKLEADLQQAGDCIKLDWKKVKRVGGDEVATITNIMERRLKKLQAG